MEQYLLDELAATAEKLVAGSGPLAAGLMSLAAGVQQLAGFSEMEAAAWTGGRELLRGVLQLGLDAQAAAEVRVPGGVTGADGIVRRRAERGHARTVTTVLGEVRVSRIAYRSGVKEALSLFPRDAVLNLPPRSFSWELQRLAVMFARDVPYGRAAGFVQAVTGVRVGTRQVQEIVLAAAADADAFRPQRHDQDHDQEQDRDRDRAAGDGVPLVISADGKGVAMRPEARRAASVAPQDRVRVFEHRAGTGEKGCKRMAETAAVYDVRVPDQARTPEQVMTPDPGVPRPDPPRAQNRWYTCGITAGRDAIITMGFDEAARRDPLHRRPWIALVDGDNYQIGIIQQQAAKHGTAVTIIIDLIHVLEYLWKAGWCFHPPRDPAIEAWVTAQALDILHGRTAEVITRIQDLAAAHPPAGPEHQKNIRKTLHYLKAKQQYLQNYPEALQNGWPIATGVIEGACRHLVQDRMGATGARWGLDSAQAVLWLRAIDASGDTAAYWDWHLNQEHHRNHTSRYALAA